MKKTTPTTQPTPLNSHPPVLTVKNITKIYKVYKNNFDRLKEIFSKKIYHKEFVSNKDISFDLHEGETLGIIGLNGAGKSTILKIIAGVTEPTSGEIVRKGRVTALLELGTGFNKHQSGYENIFLNGTLIGMSVKQCKDRAKDIIAFSELGDYIYEPVKSYSSGMKMRLAFSIALYSDPKILIVDEALSVGDAHFSAKCTKALKQRKKQKNLSIIYVSHDLNSLKLLCNRVIMLNKGSIVEQGDPQTVINKYNFLIAKLNDSKEEIKINEHKNNSFGTFDVEITDVDLKGINSNSSTVCSGEDATLTITMHSKIDISDMTIGIMIRDKFGQDIYGTNTFHHNIDITFQKDKEYICTYDLPLNIGKGKYSISVAIHSKDNHLEHCLHWLDDAKSFQVIGYEGNLFLGLCRLEPKIGFKELLK